MHATHTANTVDTTFIPTYVNKHWLILLYLIVPLCLFIVVIDIFFLASSLKQHFLPVQPAEWAFWAILFNLPHIISSFITLADKEYIAFYKKKLVPSFTVITIGVMSMLFIIPQFFTGVGYSIIYALFFIFYATYTVYHVLSQQFGIGMMLMQAPQSGLYQYFRLTATISAASLFIMVFARETINTIQLGSVSGLTLLSNISLVMLIITSLIALRLVYTAKKRFGVLYLFINMIMLYAIWLFMYLDYTVFVIMLPRFVHDLTAFMIYSVHDRNRNYRVKKNLIYRIFAFLPLSPLLLCPLLAVSFANTIEFSSSWFDQFLNTMGMPELAKFALAIVFISGFFHYHLESFVWKRDSIHRHSVPFR